MWRDLRNRLLMSPLFQRWAAAFLPTRPLARREARRMFDLVAGFVYSQVLLACVRGELLHRLAAGPLPTGRLVEGLGLDPPAALTLLKAAAALELIEHRGDDWGLGPQGAALLGNPGVLAMIEHHAVLYRDLADPLAMLRAPRGTTALSRYWPYAAGGAGGSADSAAGTLAYTRLMAASQGLVADEILDAYPVARHRRVLDVGGGDGSFLRALARRAPHAALVLADLPPVVEQAREAFAAAGLGSRVTLQGVDFRRDPLPQGADLLTLVRVLHDHDDEVVSALLRKAHDALAPGGSLLVAEPLADTPGARRMGNAYFGIYLWAMGSGRPRSGAELARMIQNAGFESPRRCSTRIPLQTSVLVAKRSAA